MISAVQILLIHMAIGMGFSMFVEKMSIKQERELKDYCNELKGLLGRVDVTKVTSLSNELVKEVEEVEQMIKAVGENR